MRRPTKDTEYIRAMSFGYISCFSFFIDIFCHLLIYKGYRKLNMVMPNTDLSTPSMHALSLSQCSQNTVITKLTWHTTNTKLLPVLPAAFFFFPVAVAVAVVSPPPIVTVPITTIPVPLGAKERISPPTVTCPPAVSVWPAMIRLVTGGGTMDAVSVMNVDGAAPFTITALPVGDNEMTCPSTVKTPPGVKVWLPITRSDCKFSVSVAEPTTKIGVDVVAAAVIAGELGFELDGKGSVMTSPPVVIALPGKSVWLPITNPEAELAVTLELPMTTTAGAGVEVGTPESVELAEPELAVGVAPLIMIAPPEFTDTCWPLIVTTAPGVKVCDPITRLDDPSWLMV